MTEIIFEPGGWVLLIFVGFLPGFIGGAGLLGQPALLSIDLTVTTRLSPIFILMVVITAVKLGCNAWLN
ncbi:hypothetical protein [Psychromonas sp.]|uniref:hypothetical protein n=1 Tax=Psychromonas sp. TaxID=1884585 RepID=UPI0035677482